MILLVFIFWFLVFTPCAHSAGEFSFSQNISYFITPNGDAKVTLDNNLSNNYSEIYAKEYQLSLTGNNLKNINGHDDFGNIITSTNISNDQTSIHLKFNQPKLGKDQITQFTLNYTIPLFATHKGNTWEITLPEFKNISDYQQLTQTISVPVSFGDLAYASIPIRSFTSLGQTNQIILNKTDIEGKKILLVFGNYQLFNFSLNYFLSNKASSAITTKIALPPDTEYQQITYDLINPKPINITVDSDGNWLAQYYLKPNQDIPVHVTGQAKILPHNPSFPGTKPNTQILTSPQEFWPVNDQSIKKIAQNLHTPRQIYDYVISSLSYNYDQIDNSSRQGALHAITFPSESLCTEFTDLFITIARANGIPSREIEGFAYTNNTKIKPLNPNTDILHAWPQYYDYTAKQWISIDPTWGKTTNGIDFFNDLDLNHFAFVIHGADSQFPPPPGSYKTNNIKTVNVTLATEELAKSTLPLTISFDKSLPPKLTLSNPNLNSIRRFQLVSNIFSSTSIDFLPPLSNIPLNYKALSPIQALLPKNASISFSLSSDTFKTYTLSTPYPYHFLYQILLIGVAIIILSIGGIIITSPIIKHEKNT